MSLVNWTDVLLPFQSQLVSQLMSEPVGLWILAPGLGLNVIVQNYTEQLTKLQRSQPYKLLYIFLSSGSTPIFSKFRSYPLQTYTFVNSQFTKDQRQVLWNKGGIYFVTSRVFIIDLLKNRVPYDRIGGIMFVITNHDIISDSTTESFILRLYASNVSNLHNIKNRTVQSEGLTSPPHLNIKVITDNLNNFKYGFSKLTKVVQALHVSQKVFLWPRFRKLVQESLQRSPDVVQIYPHMAPIQEKSHDAIFVVLQLCLKELHKSVSTSFNLKKNSSRSSDVMFGHSRKEQSSEIDFSEWTLDNILFKSFHSRMRTILEPNGNSLSRYTKRIIGDIHSLIEILHGLIRLDAVSFYQMLQNIRRRELIENPDSPPMWLLMDEFDRIYELAQLRLYSIEQVSPLKTGKQYEFQSNPRDIDGTLDNQQAQSVETSNATESTIDSSVCAPDHRSLARSNDYGSNSSTPASNQPTKIVNHAKENIILRLEDNPKWCALTDSLNEIKLLCLQHSELADPPVLIVVKDQETIDFFSEYICLPEKSLYLLNKLKRHLLIKQIYHRQKAIQRSKVEQQQNVHTNDDIILDTLINMVNDQRLEKAKILLANKEEMLETKLQYESSKPNFPNISVNTSNIDQEKVQCAFENSNANNVPVLQQDEVIFYKAVSEDEQSVMPLTFEQEFEAYFGLLDGQVRKIKTTNAFKFPADSNTAQVKLDVNHNDGHKKVSDHASTMRTLDCILVDDDKNIQGTYVDLSSKPTSTSEVDPSQPLILTGFSDSKMPLICIHTYEQIHSILQDLSVHFIILYDPKQSIIREIECYKATRPGYLVRLYFLLYKNSSEEKMYLASIQQEQLIFERLIKEKASLVLDLTNEKNQLLKRIEENDSASGGATLDADHQDQQLEKQVSSELSATINPEKVDNNNIQGNDTASVINSVLPGHVQKFSRNLKAMDPILLPSVFNSLIPNHSAPKTASLSSYLANDKSKLSKPIGHPQVVVDIREFCSKLPGILHSQGLQIIPKTLTIADYLLSPDIAIERKSIPDLYQSFTSGRLFQQMERLVRLYEIPVLLIEFDQSEAFELQRIDQLTSGICSSSISSKLVILTIHFHKMRLIWSRSPYETAQIFLGLKEKRKEPSSAQFENVKNLNGLVVNKEDWVDETLEQFEALDVLKRFPGITEDNWKCLYKKNYNNSKNSDSKSPNQRRRDDQYNQEQNTVLPNDDNNGGDSQQENLEQVVINYDSNHDNVLDASDVHKNRSNISLSQLTLWTKEQFIQAFGPSVGDEIHHFLNHAPLEHEPMQSVIARDKKSKLKLV